MTNKIVALIPARGGSKGVPGKNLRLVGGHPLIAYSIRAALLAKGVDSVVVSTDCPEIASVSKEYGAEVPFFRPAHLAGDRSTDYDVIEHYLSWERQHRASAADWAEYVVHLRPTTPLRDPAVIEQAIQAIRSHAECTSLRSGQEMGETAYKTCEVENGYVKGLCGMGFDADRLNAPRQTFPVTYQLNGYVDILKSAFILQSKLLHGNRCLLFETKPNHEIDRPEDFALVEFLLERQLVSATSLFS